MKVLVTGLDGFTGSYIKNELESAGYTVVGLSADLRDWQAVSEEISALKPDSVLHLAAVSFVPAADSGDARVYEVNTLGTQGLLEALLPHASRLQRIVIASSSNVYGRHDGRISESQCPKPVNHYGCSKLAMEFIAETYLDRLPIVISRPFNYTGVGQDNSFLVPKIVSHFREQAACIELGNIDVYRDFSDVRWIASAYRVLLERSVVGEKYNLCSGEATSIKQILSLLEQESGHQIDIRINDKFVRANDIKLQVGDPSLINELMGESDIGNDASRTLRWMLHGQ